MANIDHLFDSGRGKLGNLVFYKVGGSGRVRTRAAHFRDCKSPAQLAQRQRMQSVNSFLNPFSGLIRITFSHEALGRTAFQAAQSYNMRYAISGEYPDIYVDKSRALLSRGPLPLPESAHVSAQPEGLLIEWENGSEIAARNLSDTLVVMALSADTTYIDYGFINIRRSDGRYMWKPALPAGTVDVWIAFRNQGQTEISNSMWLGKL
jgi:hypothetical protein